MKEYKPKQVTQMDIVFGGKMQELMPEYQDIPEEFKRGNTPWNKWQQKWFFSGLKQMPTAKSGINVKEAIAHLKAIQVSFEPKHEHKEASVAYLASLWFEKE